MDASEQRRFDFVQADGSAPWWSLLFGVSSDHAYVVVDGRGELLVRFGPWHVRTTVANVRSVRTTGPYRWWRVAGPARWSASDHGLTFATDTERGVEISFHHPVAGLDPLGLFHHPSLTVTVADVDGLISALVEASREAPDEREVHVAPGVPIDPPI